MITAVLGTGFAMESIALPSGARPAESFSRLQANSPQDHLALAGHSAGKRLD
jgi:hypothetical protein